MIPVKGVIGADALSIAVSESIESMVRNGIRTIVLHIDTPGGSVTETEQIRDSILSAPPDVRFVAFVKNAISAGIWPAFACDRIVFAPDGTMGGAVAYSVDHSTGSAEVDAKMNSILAAQVSAVAEQSGHDPDIARAMMVMEASLFLLADSKGHQIVSGERLPGTTLIRQIDDQERVLTLIGKEASEIGLAESFAESPNNLAEILGCAFHARATDAAETVAVRKAAERRKALEDAAKPKKRIRQPRPGTRPW